MLFEAPWHEAVRQIGHQDAGRAAEAPHEEMILVVGPHESLMRSRAEPDVDDFVIRRRRPVTRGIELPGDRVEVVSPVSRSLPSAIARPQNQAGNDAEFSMAGFPPVRPRRAGAAAAEAVCLTAMRTFRAGDTVEDICRACKLDRLHTVIAAEAGVPVRVHCDFCGSQHQFRGGPADRPRPTSTPGSGATSPGRATPSVRPPFDIVSERERRLEPFMSPSSQDPSRPDQPADDDRRVDLELLLRRVIREEAGVTPVVPAEKWRGGTLVLKPGNPALQERSWPIEGLFHKIVMIRNRLRTLEQQVNASDLSEDAKIKLQGTSRRATGR